MHKFFLLLLPLYLFAWELHEESDNISIYKEHTKKFKFAQYKAQMLMPAWLVNLMAWKIPYQSLYDLNHYLKLGQVIKREVTN